MPRTSILVGSKGSASAEDINTLAEGVMEQDLLGIMVWYCSVQNGFQYEVDWDGSDRRLFSLKCDEVFFIIPFLCSEESQAAFSMALDAITGR